MQPQERFSVFIKSLGVWVFVTGLGTLPLGALDLREFSDPEDFVYMIMRSIGEPLVMCVAGFWLIRSNWIADKTYPRYGVTDFADRSSNQEAASLELFSALVKTLGVLFILQGLTRVPFSLSYYHNLPPSNGGSKSMMLFEIVANPTISIVLGVLLLIATNWFVRLSFAELIGDTDTSEVDKMTFNSPQLALFAVIVKALGIWFFVNGFGRLPHAINQAFWSGFPDNWYSAKSAACFLALPVMSMLMGGLCFFTTDLFVKLAFTKRANQI
jgi:hypothetical protein